MRGLMLFFMLCSFCSVGQDTEMPFKADGDSILPFKKPLKIWYVQDLEELTSRPEIKKSPDPAWMVVSYESKNHYNNPEDRYFIVHRQKYSWRVMQIDLEQNVSIDTVYFAEVDGGVTAPEMVIGWSHADGVSGEDFSWNEDVRGILVLNCSNDNILLNHLTYYEENHYGSGVNEEMLSLKDPGFDSLGRYIVNRMNEQAIEMLYRCAVIFDHEGAMTIKLSAFDPHDRNKTVKNWPEIRYYFTSDYWVRN